MDFKLMFCVIFPWEVLSARRFPNEFTGPNQLIIHELFQYLRDSYRNYLVTLLAQQADHSVRTG